MACSSSFDVEDAEEPFALPEFPEPPPADGGADTEGEAGTEGATGGTLRVALARDPVTLDPRFLADDEGEVIVSALFEPLVRLDDQSRIVPAAASQWAVSDAGATFTFRLREAQFHDGTPVTAEDFRRTFDRIADGTAEPRSYLDYLLADVVGMHDSLVNGVPLRGVEVVDARTLRIRLDQPQPGFLTRLADPSLVPTPPAAEEFPEQFAAQPVGNGPFMMAGAREPGSFVRLAAAPTYDGAPHLDEVLFTVYEGDTSREAQWADLTDGQLHVAQVPVQRRAEAAERFGVSTDGYTGPGRLDGVTSGVYLYGFDTTRPPFDDPRARRAVSMAIDRRHLADDVLQGTRQAATSIVPPPVPGSQPGVCEHCLYDPEGAAALFEEVRADRGDELDDAAFATVTLTHSRGAIHTAIAEQIADDLDAALGVEVRFRALQLEDFVRVVRDGGAAVFRIGWDVGTADFGDYLTPLFHSANLDGENTTRFADEQVDSTLDSAKHAAAPQARATLYRSAERQILEAAPAIPLLWYRHEFVVTPEVEGLRLSPWGRLDLTSARLDPPGP